MTVDSTLHLAWGLTLNLSRQAKQVRLGQTVEDYWKNFRSQIPLNNIKDLNYYDNLFSVLSTFIRSIGFERDVYAQYLDFQEQRRKQTIKYWNDLADMASFSKEGVLIRIASFLGIGGGFSITGIAANIPGISSVLSIQNNATKAIENSAEYLKRSAIIVNDTSGFAAKLFNASDHLTAEADKLSNHNTPIPQDIWLFLLFGFIGMMGTILLLKMLKGRRIKRIINNTLAEQQSYWEFVARPSFKVSLEHLIIDIENLVKIYYPRYTEQIMTSPSEKQKTIESILPQKDLYLTNQVYLFRWPDMHQRPMDHDWIRLLNYLANSKGQLWISEDRISDQNGDNIHWDHSLENKMIISKEPQGHTITFYLYKKWYRRTETCILSIDGERQDTLIVKYEGQYPKTKNIYVQTTL